MAVSQALVTASDGLQNLILGNCKATLSAMEQTTLKVLLKDWVDWDGAAFCLGSALGLIPDAHGHGAPKYVFWSAHPTGEMLYGMLDELVKQGVLEKREEPDIQYRWNASFRGWEEAAI